MQLTTMSLVLLVFTIMAEFHDILPSVLIIEGVGGMGGGVGWGGKGWVGWGRR